MKKYLSILLIIFSISISYKSLAQVHADSTFNATSTYTNRIGYAAGLVKVLVQSDGKSLLVGWSKTSNIADRDVTVIRLNNDGSIDNTYGTSGIAKIVIADMFPQNAILNSDDQLYITGYVDFSPKDWVFLLRLETTGKLDSTFSRDGYILEVNTTNLNERVYGITLTPFEDITIAGCVINDAEDSSDVLVYSYLYNGNENLAFSSSGKKTYHIGAKEIAYDIQYDSPTKYIIGGDMVLNSVHNKLRYFVIRLIDDRFDRSFSTDGYYYFQKGAGLTTTYDIGLSKILKNTDGNYYVIGADNEGGIWSGNTVKIKNIGLVDSTYGINGKCRLNKSFNTYYNDGFIQNDSKILCAGYKKQGVNSDLLISRINTNGTIDTSFNDSSIYSPSNLLGKKIETFSIAQQADMKLIIAGNIAQTTSLFSTEFFAHRVIVDTISLINNLNDKNEFDIDIINIYPNPTSKSFYIDLKSSATITILSSLGQLILNDTRNAGIQEFNIENYPSGIYYVKVLEKDKEHTIKLIKE